MLDVLMIADHDWANTGFRFSRCLRMLGLDVLMIKANYHPFMYPEQALVHPEFLGLKGDFPSIAELIDSAKVVHFVASTSINMPPITGKKYVVQHGGSIYRENHRDINEYFNQFCDAAIIQCPDLLGLGANNEHLIYYPVDTDFIQPVYERKSEKVIIGHFPSNPSVKGTEKIEGVIRKLKNSDLGDKFEYVGSTEQVSWIKNLKRMAECDIIIETLQPELNGKKYGEWGNTALEAAALGKVVITNGSKGSYQHEYGTTLMLNTVSGEDQLDETVSYFVESKLTPQHREQTRKWVVDNHSMQATADRLWEKVYKGLLG